MQQFISLPLEQKKNYGIKGLAGQWGYTSFGKEHAKGSEAPDLKEFFLHPKTSMRLMCLDNYFDSLHPKLYEEITAGEYLDERLKEIGLNSQYCILEL